MPDDSQPLSPATGDEGPSQRGRTPGSANASSEDAAKDDTTMTWAGNRSLDSRWWWSPALWIVVGACVIGYQSGPIRSGEAIFLNWVMVAVGAAVAVAGLISLKRAHAQQRATGTGAAALPSDSSA